MAQLVFCDQDEKLRNLVKDFTFFGGRIYDKYDPLKIDIIHSASNPNFSMGAGWDLFLKDTQKISFDKELEYKNGVMSLISVDDSLKSTPELIYNAYRKYIQAVRLLMDDNEIMTIGIVGLGCGVGGLSIEETAGIIDKAITDELCIGYKGYNKDLSCKGFKFEIGKKYKEGRAKLCNTGFHYCTNISQVFEYYNFRGRNVFGEILATGDLDIGKDKVSTTEIQIGKVLESREVTRLCNTGFGNSGINNAGDRNSGDLNSGNRNSGDRNSGNRNSGNRNSGNRNSGNRNSGNLNSDTPKRRIFNKETEVDPNTVVFPRYFYFNYEPVTLTRVPYDNMALEEKDIHAVAEITGGYLKEVENTADIKEYRRKSWDAATDEDKMATIKLPNRDNKIFLEITGIDVHKELGIK